MDTLISAWQYLPENISPYLVSFGSFQLRYYSLMYLVAFAVTYILIMYRIKHEGYEYKTDTIQDIILWCIVGLILGGRLGYVFFYNFSYYFHHPLEILLPFEFGNGIRFVGISGMSYHGGALGVLVASLIYCRRHHLAFWNLADLVCPAIPLGYTFGRIGNFINGELYGRITTVPWGMYFPLDPSRALRHPSQLYEAFFEGIVLFAVLWAVRKRKKFDGFLLALYIIGYGLVRYFIEFYREPDLHLGFILAFTTMGQILCLVMILLGVAVYVYRARVSKIPTT